MGKDESVRSFEVPSQPVNEFGQFRRRTQTLLEGPCRARVR